MLGSVCLRASMTLLRKKAKLEEVFNCDAGALLMGLEYFFDTVHSSIYIDLRAERLAKPNFIINLTDKST